MRCAYFRNVAVYFLRYNRSFATPVPFTKLNPLGCTVGLGFTFEPTPVFLKFSAALPGLYASLVSIRP